MFVRSKERREKSNINNTKFCRFGFLFSKKRQINFNTKKYESLQLTGIGATGLTAVAFHFASMNKIVVTQKCRLR